MYSNHNQSICICAIFDEDKEKLIVFINNYNLRLSICNLHSCVS